MVGQGKKSEILSLKEEIAKDTGARDQYGGSSENLIKVFATARVDS